MVIDKQTQHLEQLTEKKTSYRKCNCTIPIVVEQSDSGGAQTSNRNKYDLSAASAQSAINCIFKSTIENGLHVNNILLEIKITRKCFAYFTALPRFIFLKMFPSVVESMIKSQRKHEKQVLLMCLLLRTLVLKISFGDVTTNIKFYSLQPKHSVQEAI